MKKYFVQVFITFTEEDGRGCVYEAYECDSYETTNNWTGECIRLENVNTYEEGKRKPIRKQLSRGKLITVERMNHWKHLVVIVWENGTDNIIQKWVA